MEIEGKKLPEAKRRAMGSVQRPELEEGGTAGSRADAGCGHRDVCPWRLGRQRHVQSCMQEGIRKEKGIQRREATRIEGDSISPTFSAYLYLGPGLSRCQSSNRAERHPESNLVRKPGGEDEETCVLSPGENLRKLLKTIRQYYSVFRPNL